MMATVNRQITLAARPAGLSEGVGLPPGLRAGALTGGGLKVLVRSVYLSLDPYLRARMSETEAGEGPMATGDVMTGGAVGLVVESRDPDFRIGDAVVGLLGGRSTPWRRAAR